MKKKTLAEQYDKMVEALPAMKIYDGRGTFDVYTCRSCGEQVLTTYRDKGVTPFVMKCGNCVNGYMNHTQTFTTAPSSLENVLNWVRPTKEQFLRLPSYFQNHVLQGGLMLERELKNMFGKKEV